MKGKSLTPHLLPKPTPVIYGKGVKIVEVPLGSPAGSTFYRRHGDVFGWSCVGVAVLIGAWSFRRGTVRLKIENSELKIWEAAAG